MGERHVRTTISYERAFRPETRGSRVLLFEHVSKWYGPVLGVNQVTLELHSGITGLVGSNGAGKSTLLRLATGQLRPDIGKVHVAGHNAWGWAAKRFVGYCPDADVFYEEMSGRQFVETMARLCGYRRADCRERTARSLERVGMAGRCDRRIRGYSKGMRQKVVISAALIHNPRVIFFDEPLNGLDASTQLMFKTLIKNLAAEGKTIFYCSHIMDVVERTCDRIVIIDHGRIVADGTLSELQEASGEGSLERIFNKLTSHTDVEERAEEFSKTFSF